MIRHIGGDNISNDLKKIGKIGESSKYIILPKGWGEIDDVVKIEILNENNLLLKRVDIVEKNNNSNNSNNNNNNNNINNGIDDVERALNNNGNIKNKKKWIT